MILHPARYPDESREIYRLRRWAENQAVAKHLEGLPSAGQTEPAYSRRSIRKSTDLSHRQCKKGFLYK